MNVRIVAWYQCIFFLAGMLAYSVAWAQAIAPLTTDVHTRAHNAPHERVADSSRFFTSRSGAAIYLPAEEESFVFAVFGDRTGGPNEGVEILAQAVADTNLIEPDLVMTVGDMIQGYNQTPGWLEQMNQYKGIMNELLSPWFPVAGNHDVYWRGPGQPKFQHEDNYEIHFGPLWYAFEHKNNLFVVLYSDEGNRETGEKGLGDPAMQMMSTEQLNWLRDTLAMGKDMDHIFVFLHHPRWTGGRYGDDWEKAHKLLVEAGNVSAVFAGHIHRMRYDPRDGIEYFTLATTGGGQSGHTASAGYLHHFDLVTVRKDQIAIATVPVGDILDPRAVTGQVSADTNALAVMEPAYISRLTLPDQGNLSDMLVINITNPATTAIDVEIAPVSGDDRWVFQPDHIHLRIEAGNTGSFMFDVDRVASNVDAQYRPVEIELGMDLLAGGRRFPMPVKQFTVPGTLELAKPATTSDETLLEFRMNDSGVLVDTSDWATTNTLTVEAWVKPLGFSGTQYIASADNLSLRFNNGRPSFSVGLEDGPGAVAMSETPLDSNTWYHIAGTYDGEQASLYINGKLVASGESIGSPQAHGTAMMLGADASTTGPRDSMYGLLDEVRVTGSVTYQEEFSPSRRLGTEEATQLLLHVDRARGPWLYDASSGASHARIMGRVRVGGE